MRGKRAKAYKKLMASYSQSFGFREPYQVLLDDTIILDAVKFKMDLHKSLETTLRGKVKPLITQCCIRHLYALSSPPSTNNNTSSTSPSTSTSTSTTPSKKPNSNNKSSSQSKPAEETPITPSQALAAISLAKSFERRRCNHSISDAPLSSLACLKSVILPSSLSSSSTNSSSTSLNDDGKQLSRLESLRQQNKSYNKHRYILATSSPPIRSEFRQYPGIPGIHIKRSVMVMDTISDASAQYRVREEEEKMRMGIKHRVNSNNKRARDESPSGANGVTDNDKEEGKDGDGNEDGGVGGSSGGGGGGGGRVDRETKRRRIKGHKAPNPLSVMKKKKATTKVQMPSIYSMNAKGTAENSKKVGGGTGETQAPAGESTGQKKNRRKRKKGNSGTSSGDGNAEGGSGSAMEVVADGE